MPRALKVYKNPSGFDAHDGGYVIIMRDDVSRVVEQRGGYIGEECGNIICKDGTIIRTTTRFNELLDWLNESDEEARRG